MSEANEIGDLGGDEGWTSHPLTVEDEFGPYLGDTAIAAYNVLRRHCNPRTGDAWPTVATIAYYARRSKPTVLKAIAALERVGLIRVERTKGKGQMRDHNRYFLLSVEGARQQLRALIAHQQLKLTDEQMEYVAEQGGPRIKLARALTHVVKPVDYVVNEIDHECSKSVLLRSKAILPESESDSLFQEDSESLRTATNSDLDPLREGVQVADKTVSDLRPDPEPQPAPAPAPQCGQVALFQDAANGVTSAPATPKARKARPVTPRSEIENALAEVCWPDRPAKEVWALYGGPIRRYAKEIDEANASLETPITGQEIRDKCAPGHLWYRTYLALDDTRRPTKHPTPGAIRRWLRNLEHMLASVDGVSRTPPPPAPPVLWTSSGPPPEPVTAEARRAARQQAWKEHARDRVSQPLARQDRPVPAAVTPPGQRPP